MQYLCSAERSGMEKSRPDILMYQMIKRMRGLHRCPTSVPIALERSDLYVLMSARRPGFFTLPVH